MKRLTLVIHLLFFSIFGINALAQKNNSIYFLANSNFYPGVTGRKFKLDDQFGIGYERKLNTKIAMNICFSKWYVGNAETIPYYRWECTSLDKSCEQQIVFRRNYKFIDISTTYSVFRSQKYGQVNLQLGIGGVWGVNRRIDTILLPVIEPYDYYEVKGHNENAIYFGLIPGLIYDYFLWKKRINIGLHLKLRKYFGSSEAPLQGDRGLHIGFSF